MLNSWILWVIDYSPTKQTWAKLCFGFWEKLLLASWASGVYNFEDVWSAANFQRSCNAIEPEMQIGEDVSDGNRSMHQNSRQINLRCEAGNEWDSWKSKVNKKILRQRFHFTK